MKNNVARNPNTNHNIMVIDAQSNVSILWWNGVFSLVFFIQMHMVINISLDLLIETSTWINNSIMKRTMWLFIDKKLIC
jgi:hypothetical protein